jgi:molybdopterin converting factor small subunit
VTPVHVTIRVPTALRVHCGGEAELEVALDEGASIGDVLDRVAASHPALDRRVRDETGELRRHVNVFVGADNIRDRDGLATAVADGAEVTVLPAVSGGG